ncbi:MAG: helix-turn-helix transcriptional regulator, partial [Acidobacteriota bacterium]|nr:helix-turn-helix transcriptional regulator [Acidobacteriota bacterium]
MSAKDTSELLHGTLEMLVLRVLQDGEENGFAISRKIQKMSSNALAIEEGSLYPALYRMERKGWLRPR